MFATPTSTPRLSTDASTARRSLELSGASTNPTRNHSQDEESPVTPATNGDGEVATLLRSIQRQVSAIQAQQNQAASAASERAERTSTTTTPSSNGGKRKLPKELSVSASVGNMYMECFMCASMTCI